MNADPSRSPAPSGTAGAFVLTMEHVTKTFHTARGTVRAVSDLTLQLPAGQMIGLAGPDGAGKTTLMRLAVGLLAADDGQIITLGFDVRTQSLEVQSRVGYVSQQFGLYGDLSIQQNLDLYADLYGMPTSERAQRYAALMQMTGLSPFMGRLARRLSGGMQKKLALACALLRSPELLLLDEPTAGVDPVSRRELLVILHQLVQEGTSILMSTAYVDELDTCTSVVVMDEGTVMDHVRPVELLDRVAGRTYILRGEDVDPRTLQLRLHGRPEIVDAWVDGDDLRIVTTSSDTNLERLTDDIAGIRYVPAEPRLEDAFAQMFSRGSAAAVEPADRIPPDTRPVDTAAAGGPTPVVVRDLKRRFGDFYAVRGLTFEVERGEIFGLLGPNGAGKSTAFRMLCGLMPPTEGQLLVAGVDMRHSPVAARQRIGYMSQAFSLYGTLSVDENLRFFSSLHGLTSRRRRERVAWALEQFQLEPWRKSPSGSLPLGYQQRLSLACALIHQPEILFLDEPTSGVDPMARREFWRRVISLALQGVTVLITTHFMEEAEYCDRLAIMYAGKFLAVGTPAEIKSQAQRPHPTIRDAFIELVESQQRSTPA